MTSAKPYRELTPAAVIGGVLVGALLNMGIVYAGLQIGFTIVGSTVAAVIGFGILRGLLGKGSILEVNIFQTVASSVNTVNAGIIFTVPVLFLLGFQDQIDYTALLLAAVAGSLLGVVMIIPLRKQIIEYERLRFPEGVAVATILKSPGAGMEKAKLLVTGVVISGGVAVCTHLGILGENFNLGQTLGLPSAITFIFATSMLSLGAGYLAGRGGLVVLYGTILNYWILIPIAVALGWVPLKYAGSKLSSFVHDNFLVAEGVTELPAGLAYASDFIGEFSHFTSRHVGIGMILGGAIAGILLALPALKSALSSLRSGGNTGRREEVPISVLNGGLILGMIMLFFATKLAGGDHLSWGKTFAVTLAGGAWLWLAGLVVAQTTGRTDWSPLSGLALIAIAIMMGIMGTDPVYVVPAVTVGASICVATSMCADMMADLKTGYLVGSRPYKQQLAQIMTCWIGPAIALGTVIVLWTAYGFGPDQAQVLHDRAVEAGGQTLIDFEEAGGTATKLPEGVPELGAPQAGALKSAIQIVQDGNVPIGKYAGGAILGVVVSFLVSPGLGVMVGLSMYLPFEYMIVFGIGGILNILISRRKGVRWAEDKGVPLAAGLIVGDALVGVTFAIIEVASSMSA
ncbi:MAG: OPT/YSL family transporter [Planctomycetes bacterium]|nr:OPT/YSL family transporter [Planctomycetota bacterium]